MTDKPELPLDDSPSENANDFGEPILGVLFVHGIGDQKRGETVPWAGDPLYRWLTRWFDTPNKEGRNIYLSDARLSVAVPSEGDAPPYTHLRFEGFPGQNVKANHQWILAESYWAAEFTAPTYAETIPLGLVVGPVIVERIGGQIIGRLLQVIRQTTQGPAVKHTGRQSVLDIIGDALWIIMNAVIRVLSGLFLFIVGSFLQLLMVSLTLLGLLPFLSSVVQRLQLKVAGWLGDAYLMAVSPVRLTAMVSKVRRDIQWLVTKEKGKGCCKAIAVVAHSGGAVIAHKALTGPDAPKFDLPVLLITYGSGQRKVHIMEKMDTNKTGFFRFSSGMRIVSAGSLLVFLILLMQEHPSWIFVLIFGFLGLLLQAVLLIWAENKRKATESAMSYEPLMPNVPPATSGGAWVPEWADYGAVADIVSDKSICANEPGEPRVNVTARVHIMHSPMKDHGSYWLNKEEFLADVSRLLYKKATGIDLASRGKEQTLMDGAKDRREKRVLRLLTATLLLIGCLPGLWLGLEPLLGDLIGNPIRSFLVNFFTNQPIGIPSFPGTSDPIPTNDLIWFWSHLFGGLTLAGLLTFIDQQILVVTWRSWSRAEETAFFQKKDSTTDEVSRDMKGLFAIAMVVIPLVATTLVTVKVVSVLLSGPVGWQYAIVISTFFMITWIIMVVALASAFSTLKDEAPGSTPTRESKDLCEVTESEAGPIRNHNLVDRVLERIRYNQVIAEREARRQEEADRQQEQALRMT